MGFSADHPYNAAVHFRRHLKVVVGIVVVLLVNVGMAYVLHQQGLYQGQTYFNDLAMRSSVQQPDPRIVIVAIDDQSLNDFGPLGTWDRAVYGALIRRLKDAGARVTAFDVLFDLPTGRDPLLAQAIAYARSNAGGTPPMPVVLAEDGDGAQRRIAGQGLGYDDFLRPSPAIMAGRPILANVTLDPDGAEVRHLPLRAVAGAQHSYLLPFMAANLYLHRPSLQDAKLLPNAIAGNGWAIPTDPDYRMLIDFEGRPAAFTHVSLSRVVAGQYPAATFRDKLVLVGMMGATGFADSYPVPTSPGDKMWGVEIWANGAQNILDGKFVVQQGELTTLLFMLALSAIAALGFVLSGALGWSLTAALLVAYTGAAYLWTTQGLAGPPGAAGVVTLPNVAYVDGDVLASSLFLFGWLFVFEQRAQRVVQQMFGKYVTPEVAKMLVRLQDEGELGLGGVRKRATIMFGDIRGFTTLSEGMEPEEVMAMLNRYFGRMVQIITKHGGTVSKYIGDNVMVLFNLPVESNTNHALAAARAGFEIQEWIEHYRAEHPEEQAAFGFGISSGSLMAGNIGSQQRMEYTVVGDPVREADELCATALANEVAISESTFELIKDTGIEVVDKGMVTVKGKVTQVHMYTVVGLGETAAAA